MILKSFSTCLKIDVVLTLERGKTPIAYCFVYGESLRFDQSFRPFFSHFAIMKFNKVKFIDISSAGKTAIKITKILQSFSF